MERRADEYDPYADQREQFGEALGEQKVFCLGCQESLIVTLAEAQRSRRDYRVSLLGSNEDRPSFYLGTDPAAARAAMLAGAVRMMKCFFGPDSWSDVEAGRAIVVRGPGDWEVKAVYSESPGANAPCDKCRARPASWTATDARVEPWVDRLLCAPCTAEELTPRALADIESVERWVTGLSEKGRRTGAERITSAIGALEQWWAHLPAPPEVAAALARIRALAP